MKQLIAIITLLTIILSSCYYDNKTDLYQFYQNQCDTTAISYSIDIEPIISTQCISCHQQPSPNGGVLLENYNDVKASAEIGSLGGTVTGTNGFAIMPPTGAMLQCNIDKVDAWIKAGMPNN